MNLDYFKINFPDTIKSLETVKLNGRLSHAYIVYCDNSEIREKFSKFLVKFFLCGSSELRNTPCGVCNSCVRINKGIYPDLHELEPSSKTRKIKVGDGEEDEGTLRWFQSKFSYSSMSETGWKAGIIYDADCLMPQAQNAFLKTLEEPTKRTFFVLATENPSSLLPTIRSRCQTIQLLTNKISYSFEGSDELFKLLPELIMNGSFNLQRAVEISESIISLFSSLYLQAEKIVESKWTKKLEEAENLESKTAKKQIKERYLAAVESQYRLLRKQFLDGIYIWFAQLYQLKQGISFDKISNPEIFDNSFDHQNITEAKSFKALRKSEEFIAGFYWNINESLAIQEFCLSFVNI